MVSLGPQLSTRVAAVLALGLSLGKTAVAANETSAVAASRVPVAVRSVEGAEIAACSGACAAQQSLTSALHEPIRIGKTQLKLGVASSRLTFGWAIAF